MSCCMQKSLEKAYVLIWKIFFNNQKEIWSQGRNVESQNFKNRRKKLHNDKQMLDVVFEIEFSDDHHHDVIWLSLDLIHFKMNKLIDRTSIHDEISLKWLKFEQLGDDHPLTTKAIPWTASKIVSVRWWNFKDGGS